VRRADKVLGPASDAFWDYLAQEGRRFLPSIPGDFFPEDAAAAAPLKAVRSPAEAGE
jgi:hypothetical protein